MSDVAIKVEGIGKRYRLGMGSSVDRTLREVVSDGVGSVLRRVTARTTNGDADGRARDQEDKRFIWALRNVSFETRYGDVVGIIGRNGAGKSTLLKVLSCITDPTEGRGYIYGRVGSLLEVGTGFHPELSGRENIFLNGAILGMTRAEIQKKFDEIVAFAEIDRFIDTPVKRYSSGMYVRLAFSVAAHLEPEVLIIDEVLAVGDAAFQKKCLGKMGDIAKQGRTVLFVSHNMQAVSTLTKRCLLLSKGGILSDGPTVDVISDYLRESGDHESVYQAQPSVATPKITRVELRTSEPGNVQLNGAPMEVLFEISTPVPVRGASLSFQACNSLLQPVLHLWTFDSERPMCRETGTFRVICRIPKVRLYFGQYTLMVHFSERPGGDKFETIEGICPFRVELFGQHREFQWQPGACAYLEECEWTIGKVE